MPFKKKKKLNFRGKEKHGYREMGKRKEDTAKGLGSGSLVLEQK